MSTALVHYVAGVHKMERTNVSSHPWGAQEFVDHVAWLQKLAKATDATIKIGVAGGHRWLDLPYGEGHDVIVHIPPQITGRELQALNLTRPTPMLGLAAIA